MLHAAHLKACVECLFCKADSKESKLLEVDWASHVSSESLE